MENYIDSKYGYIKQLLNYYYDILTYWELNIRFKMVINDIRNNLIEIHKIYKNIFFLITNNIYIINRRAEEDLYLLDKIADIHYYISHIINDNYNNLTNENYNDIENYLVDINNLIQDNYLDYLEKINTYDFTLNTNLKMDINDYEYLIQNNFKVRGITFSKYHSAVFNDIADIQRIKDVRTTLYRSSSLE